jgi:hypothetical protein
VGGTHHTPEVERHSDRRSNWQSDYNIVVVRAGKNRFGLIADRLFDMEEIVVKPLASFLRDCRWFSGATILGDGEVILILDVLGVSALANLHFTDLAAEDRRHWEEEKRKRAEAELHRQSVILLRGGADEQFAMRQSEVSRLERVLPEDIQRMGDREFIEYRGMALPLLRLDRILPVHPLPDSLAEYFVVIPSHTSAQPDSTLPAGILVSEILDACDVYARVQAHSVSGPGLLGAALLSDRITLFPRKRSPPRAFQARNFDGNDRDKSGRRASPGDRRALREGDHPPPANHTGALWPGERGGAHQSPGPRADGVRHRAVSWRGGGGGARAAARRHSAIERRDTGWLDDGIGQ